MVVGDDNALLSINDKARAQRGDPAVARPLILAVAKELVKEILERRAVGCAHAGLGAAAVNALRGGDVDHRIEQPLGQIRHGRRARIVLGVGRRHGGRGHQHGGGERHSYGAEAEFPHQGDLLEHGVS
jgi:hypothetical protein